MERGCGGAEALAAFPGLDARGAIVQVDNGLGGDVTVSLLLDGSMRWESQLPQRWRRASWPDLWHGAVAGAIRSPRRGRCRIAFAIQYSAMAAPFVLTREARSALEVLDASPEGWTRLQWAWREDRAIVYDIDEESGFVRRVTTHAPGDEAYAPIVTELSDYREVHGERGAVMLPFRARLRMGDRWVSETKWNRIEEKGRVSPRDVRSFGLRVRLLDLRALAPAAWAAPVPGRFPPGRGETRRLRTATRRAPFRRCTSRTRQKHACPAPTSKYASSGIVATFVSNGPVSQSLRMSRP